MSPELIARVTGVIAKTQRIEKLASAGVSVAVALNDTAKAGK